MLIIIYIGNFNILEEYKKRLSIKILFGLKKMVENWGKDIGAEYIVADIYNFNTSMLAIAKYLKYEKYTQKVIKKLS